MSIYKVNSDLLEVNFLPSSRKISKDIFHFTSNILTKEFLEKEYIINKKTALEIARKTNNNRDRWKIYLKNKIKEANINGK